MAEIVEKAEIKTTLWKRSKIKLMFCRAMLVLVVVAITPAAFAKQFTENSAVAPGDPVTCAAGTATSGQTFLQTLTFLPGVSEYGCYAGVDSTLFTGEDPNALRVQFTRDESPGVRFVTVSFGASFSNVAVDGVAKASGVVDRVYVLCSGVCSRTISFTIGSFNYSGTIIWDGANGFSATTYLSGTPVADTQQTVGSFSENRVVGIGAVQPQIGGFVTGSGGSFVAAGDGENLAVNYAASVILDPASQTINASFDAVENASRIGNIELWTQIFGANINAGNAASKLWVGYFGGHTFLSEDMLVGALVQVDYAEENNKTAGSDGHGTGWMFGPYIAGKVTGQSVFYEARLALGGSDNKISPTGAYTDSFKTERWMASAKLNGAYAWGDVTFSPNIGISYFSEKQNVYTDSLANLIPSQTITSGEISFGPEVSKKITLSDGATLIPKAGLSAIYTYESASTNAAQVLTFKNGDLRAKLDIGVSILALNGMTITTDLFYDGLGIADYESWGGQVKWTVPLQ